jgi:hypothetical protein
VGDERRTEVRSYRSVFALERRIYRIDRLRLNPTGVPVRGIAYAAALIVLAQLLQSLPLVAGLAALIPWPLRDVIGPVALAAPLTALRLDGRLAHHALVSALRFAIGPRHVSGFAPAPCIGTTWRPGPLVLVPDGSQSRLRALRYRGPGRLLVAAAHATRSRAGFRASDLEIRAAPEGDRVPRGIRVPAGGRVRVVAERACGRR